MTPLLQTFTLNRNKSTTTVHDITIHSSVFFLGEKTERTAAAALGENRSSSYLSDQLEKLKTLSHERHHGRMKPFKDHL
jgi:hypothetical protein